MNNSRQTQAPSGSFLNEDTAYQYQAPDGTYINETAPVNVPPYPLDVLIFGAAL